jgi:hypothetical protein
MKKVSFCVLIIFLALPSFGQSGEGAKLDSIVNRVIAVRDAEIAAINNLTLDAVSYEKREDGDGNVKETKKYIKKVHLKKVDGGKYTYREEYSGYFINGVRQDDKQLPKVAEERADRKKKRGGKDISFDIVSVLRPDMKKYYIVKFEGIAEKPVNGFECFKVRAVADSGNVPDAIRDTLVNILYYVDIVSYHVVKAEFAPANLISKFMFKMNTLDMSLEYEPYDETIWLPARFHIKGRAKAMYIMGIYFEGEEDYSNAVVNGGN